MIELRPATVGDADAVATVYITSWNEGFGDLLGVRDLDQSHIGRWQVDLASTTTDWTIAELDSGVAGFIGVGPSRDPIDPALGELDTIAVAPRYWRRGIGRALMTHGVAQLRAQWSQAILWTPAHYSRGHAFYHAMGWHQLDKIRASGTEVAFGREL